MNYSEKVKHTLLSTEVADFDVMVDSLLAKVCKNNTVMRLLFFGNPSSNEEYLNHVAILEAKINASFSGEIPGWSYIAEAPLEGELLLEVHACVREEGDRVRYRSIDGLPYVLFENKFGRFLFASGIQSNILKKNTAEQSLEIFACVEKLLQTEGFSINSIVRQWNYIERITDIDGNIQNYQAFNDARSSLYEKTAWPRGYPAATGIGTQVGGVLVDFDAVDFASESGFMLALDNKLQVPAHQYSKEVLISDKKTKTTPKFERAKYLSCVGSGLVYISGTAAIRGEKSLENNLKAQLKTTVENIRWLISDENKSFVSASKGAKAKFVLLRVYLKDRAYVKEAKEFMESYNLNIPIAYLLADICREELLVEIEGVACVD